jgi:hypothetical protein
MRAIPDGVLEHGQLPDPEGQEIQDLKERVAELEEKVNALATALTPGTVRRS